MTARQPAARGWLAAAERYGRNAENVVLVILLVALVALASGQIILRNVFSIGLLWADGLVRLLVLWLAVIGAIAASRDHKHIAIDALARIAPPKLKQAAAFFSSLFTSVVMGLLAYHSWRFVADSREYGDMLLSTWPAWVFQLVLPVGFALIAYRYLVRALSVLRGDG